MITLAIDASTYIGDVAVLDGSCVLAEDSVAMKDAQREHLMPAVSASMERAGVRAREIQRGICGAGPRRFTSLPIWGANSKGLASGVGCPLFAVSSMALVLGSAQLPSGRYLVAVDALRDEFYIGLYTIDPIGAISEVEPVRRATSGILQELAESLEARVVSPSPLAGAITAGPRARAVALLEHIIHENGPVSLDTWEPSYGRLAEAQVRWEFAHRQTLPSV
jgi:tRNA threonylcarbamoyladenosine biosynthesis protein TsaB